MSLVDARPRFLERERYLSSERFEAENRKLWSKVWQMACREGDVPTPGDSYEHTIGDESILVVRTTAGGVRAYFNTCPHRGQRLRQGCSSGATIQCPFHAWTWDLDGGLKSVPSRWDFPDVTDEAYALRQCRAETWGGFVFVNMDLEAEPLADFLEPTQRLHEQYRLHELSRVLWLEVEVKANWKIVAEAFLEAYHIVGNHPQMLLYTDDVNTRYELFGRHGRLTTPVGDASPHLDGTVDAHGSFEALVRDGALVALEGYAGVARMAGGGPAIPLAEDPRLTLPEGMTSRQHLLNLRRQALERAGVDLTGMTDTDIVDAAQYHVFPNLMIMASATGAQYMRMRPNGSHESTLYEFVVLARPAPGMPAGEAPKQSFDNPTEAIEFLRRTYGDSFALGFDQDLTNLHHVHRAIKSAAFTASTLGTTQDLVIANMHSHIDRYLNEED